MRKLELGPCVRVGAWALHPIELTTAEASACGSSGCVRASKTPYALIVVGVGTREAFDARGRRIPLTELIADVPAIADALQD